ncbi:AraC family transcriptional regulator [Mucilaginibacter sp. KACC 22063]|uniref:AraC family transcriptional regulator n=1 Tax=Mucilaginibacter sp. KACC 22063 TaxID=3025666 RepID=UPI002366C99D|nr:AraC family transcriptional regulator [Mucilaginibacter sp. KACC 22063]WDF53834.1 AraC family transcriptional regulator [Mucilaginibacter sp. KACC 22063]
MSNKRRDGFEGEKLIYLPPKIWKNVLKRHPNIFQIYVTQIGYFPKASYHYRERRKGCKDNIFIYCLQGKGHYVLENKKYTVTANQFIVLPATDKYMRYWADAEDPWTIYWIHYTGDQIDVFNQFLNVKSHKGPIAIPFNAKAIGIWDNMYESLEMGYSLENLSNASFCLYNFLATFLFPERHLKTVQSTDVINNSVLYMKANLDKKLTVEQIAEHNTLSTSHFSAIFKKATGMPPMDYFINIKMQSACQLLYSKDARIKTVAAKLGYSDAFYFSRVFKKYMGISPEHYKLTIDKH